MTCATKVILHASDPNAPALADFVEHCRRSGVRLICVWGPGSEDVHDAIDELLVDDGRDEGGIEIMTTWHDGETLAEVTAFAESFEAGPVQGVVL